MHDNSGRQDRRRLLEHFPSNLRGRDFVVNDRTDEQERQGRAASGAEPQETHVEELQDEKQDGQTQGDEREPLALLGMLEH